MSSKLIYLDFAATTPIDQSVLLSMQPYLTDNFYNPSANYLVAKEVKKDLESARQQVAYWLGSKSSEIIFTAGASEANNIAIQGVMRKYPNSNMVLSAIEHESVIKPAYIYPSKQIMVNKQGIVNLEDLENNINDQTVLVSVMYVNNEIGTIQPLRKISNLINKIKEQRLRVGNKLPLYFHTDATQAANYLDLHVSRLGVDMMSLNGSKIYGTKQTGILYIRSGIIIEPLIYGGGQEKNIRSGTENVAGAIGFATALNLVQKSRQQESARLEILQQYFFKYLKTIPGALINGSVTQRITSNIHFTIPGQDNERIIMSLDERGILASTGSACSASSHEPSHVLKALGLSDQDASSSVRLTMGRFTTIDELSYVCESLNQILKN